MMNNNLVRGFAAPAVLMMLAAAFSATVRAAESEAPVPATDSYDTLYLALMAGADAAAMIENQLNTLEHTLVTQDPNIAAMESLRPGFLDAFSDVLRPWMFEHSKRMQERYRPDFIAILKADLTRDDAGRMATFYASPIGVKLLRGVSRNFTATNTLGDIDDFESDVTVEAVGRDLRFAASAGAMTLSDEDLTSQEAAVLRDPTLMAKMSRTVERIVVLRVTMETAEPDPDIAQGMNDDIDGLIAEYFPETARSPDL